MVANTSNDRFETCEGALLYQGDCLEVMPTMPDASIDSIVTDPPYGLGFMGKKWDIGVPAVDVFIECLRVLKPGGHLLAFGGTRTSHRLVCAIEDAGFEIRDTIAWLYGSGFPKSRNVGKEVSEFEGWGTALKPAMEPICVARKPLEGTVAANVMEYGTGALNIEGCRVPHATVGNGNLAENPHLRGGISGGNGGHIIASEESRRVSTPSDKGRWPANVIHDGGDEVLEGLPYTKTGTVASHSTKGMWGSGADTSYREIDPGGSAARFFYCAKASKADRNDGLDGGRNTHPTVKPTGLMRYLCRLVTPPGGVVLDPFMGSGSTGKGAIIEGFRFIGIEYISEYVEISGARIASCINSDRYIIKTVGP